jgi:hypothetical protein
VTASTIRVDPRWLALRGPADARARTAHGATVVADLTRHLLARSAGGARRAVRLVDVGAGTGAGAAWLRWRLPVAQSWRLIDRDADLLALATPVADGWAEPVVADLAELPRLLAARPADVVTCQALLDLLTADQIATLLRPAVASDAAVLLSLSVTGHVTLRPEHPDDDLVNEAFNAHQHRSHLLGPDAGKHAAAALRARGYTVTAVPTPWRLGSADRDLTAAWLHGRAQAAGEQMPGDSGRIARWLAQRLAAAARGGLVATVGHVDVLGIPPGRTGERP